MLSELSNARIARPDIAWKRNGLALTLVLADSLWKVPHQFFQEVAAGAGLKTAH